MAKTKVGKKKRLKSRKPSAGNTTGLKDSSAKGNQGPEPKHVTAQVPERIREKESGLEVLKILGFVIIALALGTAVMMKVAGGEKDSRGDLKPGDLCLKTIECQTGSVCFAYPTADKLCYATCGPENDCEDADECVKASEVSGAKQSRTRSICASKDQSLE